MTDDGVDWVVVILLVAIIGGYALLSVLIIGLVFGL